MLRSRTGALNLNTPVTTVVGLIIVASLLGASLTSFVINFTAAETAGLPTWVETMWYIMIGLAIAGLGWLYAKQSGFLGGK